MVWGKVVVSLLEGFIVLKSMLVMVLFVVCLEKNIVNVVGILLI